MRRISMLTKMKKVFFVVMFAAFALVFAACGDGGKLNKALKGIELDAEVEFGFQLPDAELEKDDLPEPFKPMMPILAP